MEVWTRHDINRHNKSGEGTGHEKEGRRKKKVQELGKIAMEGKRGSNIEMQRQSQFSLTWLDMISAFKYAKDSNARVSFYTH